MATARSPKLFVAAPPSLLASGSVSVARRTSGPPPSSPPSRSRAFDLLVSSRYRERMKRARGREREKEKARGRKRERRVRKIRSGKERKGSKIEAKKEGWSERKGLASSREINLIFKQIWRALEPRRCRYKERRACPPICVPHRNLRRFSIDPLDRSFFFIYSPSTAQRSTKWRVRRL